MAETVCYPYANRLNAPWRGKAQRRGQNCVPSLRHSLACPGRGKAQRRLQTEEGLDRAELLSGFLDTTTGGVLPISFA